MALLVLGKTGALEYCADSTLFQVGFLCNVCLTHFRDSLRHVAMCYVLYLERLSLFDTIFVYKTRTVPNTMDRSRKGYEKYGCRRAAEAVIRFLGFATSILEMRSWPLGHILLTFSRSERGGSTANLFLEYPGSLLIPLHVDSVGVPSK